MSDQPPFVGKARLSHDHDWTCRMLGDRFIELQQCVQEADRYLSDDEKTAADARLHHARIHSAVEALGLYGSQACPHMPNNQAMNDGEVKTCMDHAASTSEKLSRVIAHVNASRSFQPPSAESDWHDTWRKRFAAYRPRTYSGWTWLVLATVWLCLILVFVTVSWLSP